MCLLKVVWYLMCDYIDTNINVNNAIKLSHFEVKDLSETNVMHLVLLKTF